VVEAGAVREVEASYATDAEAGRLPSPYASPARRTAGVLERHAWRGVFATLDAAARALAGLGLAAFRVDAAGLAGEEEPL